MTHENDKPIPPLDVDDPSSPYYIPSYKIEKARTGFSLETDGTDKDHEHALEALRRLLGGTAVASVSTGCDFSKSSLECHGI